MIKDLIKKFGEESTSTPAKLAKKKKEQPSTKEESEAQEAAITLSTELPKGKFLK